MLPSLPEEQLTGNSRGRFILELILERRRQLLGTSDSLALLLRSRVRRDGPSRVAAGRRVEGSGRWNALLWQRYLEVHREGQFKPLSIKEMVAY
jgi:hypothetical protein